MQSRSNRFANAILLLLLSTAVSWLATACGPRYARVKVQDSGGISIKLRSQKGVERGFAHPATISGARLAHILSFVDVRAEKDGRKPAVHLDSVYPLGESLSRAFARAESHQELVVEVTRTERRLGLFTDKHLTSFVTYLEGDSLIIHWSRVDWPVPKQREDDSLEPWPNKRVQSFRVLPSEYIAAVGTQGVSVDWRDKRFRHASNLRFSAGGKLRRKQMLLDAGGGAEVENEVRSDEPVLPKGLSPAQLRDLADLEEARRQGEVAEAEYHRRRREILEAASAP